jgi:hypothetical protein
MHFFWHGGGATASTEIAGRISAAGANRGWARGGPAVSMADRPPGTGDAMPTLKLPTAIGHLAAYRMGEPRSFAEKAAGPFNRVALAAAHVVADPLADIDPWLDVAIDWERTIAFRERLWDLGLGVAEAMDTAQRGMGLEWNASRELIRRSLEAASARQGAVIFCGAGTDHLTPSPRLTIDDVIRAYEEQIDAIERIGGRIILMASRALAACARSPDDYVTVYDRILAQLRAPCIIHWLGEMFDPALDGYFGHLDHMAAMDVCVAIIEDNAAKVDGIKLSLLDKDKEIALRARLPAAVRMYTGDDFNYAELIAGDGERYSHALLGIFDPIAPAASAALSALAEGRTGATRSWRRPCRCPATSSRRRPASTRPAWCSWPGSTATRTTSSWSAARKARARFCISPSCSGSPTPPACCAIPTWPRPACAPSWRCMASKADARSVGWARVAVAELGDGARAMGPAAGDRGLRPPRHCRHRALAGAGAGDRRRRGGASDPRSRPRGQRPLPRRHVRGR